ncbi:Uroporphyrinogen synthase [Guillardia theta CCMP2712]|uniref:Uroporphyrinogen-III synthase n=2 Tax=Guillardia theta TaxID=55529 RepID=L1JFY6_GUITC|nr:Uroporphyrinogen synthase [Guillardia theta CCMP2712]EKX47010.1 Uroporphyrinogen synthase [Guillardia theta CCMP2712]|eukprot:XP_005833990.1 Uroporphyrinogen synthase [Guillardia theta CCMP2712]
MSLEDNKKEEKVLNGIKHPRERFVALTRELGKNLKLEKALSEKGVRTVELPCIAFEAGIDSDSLPSALKEDWEYVVVTSPEAASVFLDAWRLASQPSLQVACVGTGTKQALQEGGIEPVFMPSKATGKTLADELPGPQGNGRVLYPASAKARTEVQGGLTARGFTVTRLNTYDTVSATWSEQELQMAASAAVVALASPSAVKTWAERLGTKQYAACIGETSASACKELGFEHVFWPESPGIPGWAQAVHDALEEMESAEMSRSK